MTPLKFSDGQTFEVDSKPHIEKRSDGLYVVGKGFLVPCSTQAEAEEMLKILVSKSKNHTTV